MSLMPEWRLAGKSTDADDAWLMSRTTPGTEAWKKVRKTGPYGVFLALLGFAIWCSASVAGQSSRREYVSALEDVSWVMGQIVKDMVPFVHRNRPARSSEPALQSEAELNGAAVRRSSTRTSHPTKRKLGISDLSPSEPRSAKRRSLGA